MPKSPKFTITKYKRNADGHLERQPDGRCTVVERKAYETNDWSDALIRAMAAGEDWHVAMVGHEDRLPYREG